MHTHVRLSALYSTKTSKKQEIQTKSTGRSPNQKKPHTIIQGKITGGEPETKATQIIWISSFHSVYQSNSHNKYLLQHYYHTKKQNITMCTQVKCYKRMTSTHVHFTTLHTAITHSQSFT